MSAELLKRANDMAGGLQGSEGLVNFHGQFLADLFVAAGRELPPGPVPEMVAVPANEFCEMVAVATERYVLEGNARPAEEPPARPEPPKPADWSESKAEPVAEPQESKTEPATQPEPEAVAETTRRRGRQA